MTVTKAEADRIVEEPKICMAVLQWKQVESEERHYRLEARVLIPSIEKTCHLRGVIGKTNYSFSLLFDNFPIRKYTVHQKHKMPDGKIVWGPHKHTWDELNEDRWVYVPNDITQGDINQAFLDFLKESNIQIRGKYQGVMFRS